MSTFSSSSSTTVTRSAFWRAASGRPGLEADSARPALTLERDAAPARARTSRPAPARNGCWRGWTFAGLPSGPTGPASTSARDGSGAAQGSMTRSINPSCQALESTILTLRCSSCESLKRCAAREPVPVACPRRGHRLPVGRCSVWPRASARSYVVGSPAAGRPVPRSAPPGSRRSGTRHGPCARQNPHEPRPTSPSTRGSSRPASRAPTGVARALLASRFCPPPTNAPDDRWLLLRRPGAQERIKSGLQLAELAGRARRVDRLPERLDGSQARRFPVLARSPSAWAAPLLRCSEGSIHGAAATAHRAPPWRRRTVEGCGGSPAPAVPSP